MILSPVTHMDNNSRCAIPKDVFPSNIHDNRSVLHLNPINAKNTGRMEQFHNHLTIRKSTRT
jgi:hypothetical protein